MANTKAMLVDGATRHAIFVQRYSGSQLKQMLPYLQRVKKTTAAALAMGDLTEFSKKRLTRLYNEMGAITNEVLNRMGEKLKSNMKQFASYEADFAGRMLDNSTKDGVEFDIPAKTQIHAAVFSEPVLTLEKKGITLDAVLEQFSEKKGDQIVKTIQQGVIAGQTNQEIIKGMSAIVDTSMADGLKALVRTVTNHVSSVSREEVLKNNEDIIEGYEWVSVLDGRTTPECQALDGQIFGVGEGPIPPIHWNCRSTRIPVVKKEYSFVGGVEGLTRAAKGAEGAEDDVSTKTNYNDWLKTQPNEFQDEVLGVTKGQLFREGGLDLTQFVDENYKPLSIEQLRQSDDKHIVAAFKKIDKGE